jgi:WD40 repeat protein
VVAFSPNGQMLATADRNGGISVWDPDSAQEMFTLAGHKSSVTALSWRGDSKLLASASEDGFVKLWEMDEGRIVKNWAAHAAGVLSVSYAHDGNLVTCGRDNAVTLWDGTGKKLRDLEKGCDLPLSAVFTSDNARVFASDFDGQVATWTIKNGKKIGNLDANPLPQSQKLATLQMPAEKQN